MIKVKELTNVVSQAISGCKVATSADAKNQLFHDGKIFSWSPSLSVMALLPEGCEHLEGVISSNDLYNLLNRIKKAEIDIQCNENEWVITSDTMTVDLATRQDEGLIERMKSSCNFEELEWKELPKNFYNCMAVCNIPGNKAKTQGLYFRGDTLYSTDLLRYHRAIMDGALTAKNTEGVEEPVSVWLSSFSATEILKSGIKFEEYAIGNKWMYFRSRKEDEALLVFACSRLDERAYPADKLEKIFDILSNGEGITGTFPKMDDVLDLAQVFDSTVTQTAGNGVQRRNENVISVKFDRNRITVSSERNAAGRFTEKIAYPEGKKLDIADPVRVNLTGPFLKEALRYTQDFTLVDQKGSLILLMKGDFFTTLISTIA